MRNLNRGQTHLRLLLCVYEILRVSYHFCPKISACIVDDLPAENRNDNDGEIDDDDKTV